MPLSAGELYFPGLCTPRAGWSSSKTVRAAGSLASELNPEPATNGGRPLSASQNEDKQAKKGLLCHLFSPMGPSKSQPVRLGTTCSPGRLEPGPGRNACRRLETGLRREGSGVLLSGAGGLPPNLLQGPQTSLTNQAAVPFAPSVQGPLKSFHVHPALSPGPQTNHTSSQSRPPNLPLR